MRPAQFRVDPSRASTRFFGISSAVDDRRFVRLRGVYYVELAELREIDEGFDLAAIQSLSRDDVTLRTVRQASHALRFRHQARRGRRRFEAKLRADRSRLKKACFDNGTITDMAEIDLQTKIAPGERGTQLCGLCQKSVEVAQRLFGLRRHIAAVNGFHGRQCSTFPRPAAFRPLLSHAKRAVASRHIAWGS